MYEAILVAYYYLYRAYQEEEAITNLKLQKLLYYAQGFYLAFFKKPLFSNPIEAWTHGPVVPDVYRSFKQSGAEPIPGLKTFDKSVFDQDTLGLLDEVYKVFGQFSAFALRNMSHEEPPWDQTPIGNEIDLELMKSYFETRIEHDG
jgi:uncharacterized phage-associated protein